MNKVIVKNAILEKNQLPCFILKPLFTAQSKKKVTDFSMFFVSDSTTPKSFKKS